MDMCEISSRELDVDTLCYYLEYVSGVGKFFWRRSPRSGWVGREAGCLMTGRCVIRFLDRGWFRSRLVWLAETGEFPAKGLDIDHMNRDKLDDRFCNLRLVTRSQNCMNKEVQSNNSTGYRNIHVRVDGRFVVQVQKNGVRTQDFFTCLEDAVLHRDFLLEHFHGEFKGAYNVGS